MYIGRYYFDKKKWIPAINRFRVVVDDYEHNIYVKKHFIDWLKFIIH